MVSAETASYFDEVAGVLNAPSATNQSRLLGFDVGLEDGFNVAGESWRLIGKAEFSKPQPLLARSLYKIGTVGSGWLADQTRLLGLILMETC